MEILLRPSVPEDVPVQRTLWSLSFGDDRAYINNFYKNYYRPDRVLVLEAEGAVRAMTAWFSTVLSIPGKDQIFRAAYLYAVCVHPDWRGKGLASKLLEGAGLYFRDRGIQAVTTVPASRELHGFFAKQGFFECFTQDEHHWTPELAQKAPETLPKMKLVNAAEYGVLREGLLSKLGHIALPMDALLYQAGCCRIDGGGMYLVGAPAGPAALCAEGTGDKTLLVKELIGSPEAVDQIAAALPQLLPKFGGTYRTLGDSVPFGMMKWLSPELDQAWDRDIRAYLGLAFD